MMDKNNGMSVSVESSFNKEQPDELKNIIEAAVVISEEPISVDKILGMFTDETKPERSTVKELLFQLEQDYSNRGIELRYIDKGYRIQTREEYSPWLARLRAGRPPKYSRAMLETLAIIAYRQPVTRGEIEEIRGVAVSTDIIRTLQEREWVRQVGVRDVPGKPALFGTTKGFLEYFSLEGLSHLPTLQDIRDMDTIAAELNMKLPLEERVPDEPVLEADNTDSSADKEIEENPQADMLDDVNEQEQDDQALENDASVEIDNEAAVEDDLATENDSDSLDAKATDEA